MPEAMGLGQDAQHMMLREFYSITLEILAME
jgi:hypothetical protein